MRLLQALLRLETATNVSVQGDTTYAAIQRGGDLTTLTYTSKGRYKVTKLSPGNPPQDKGDLDVRGKEAGCLAKEILEFI